MNDKHTPTPWMSMPTASLGPQYAIYPEADGPTIAVVYDHGSGKANADFIVRAVNAHDALLEACKAIAALADGQGRANMLEVAALARAAIAKAQV